MEVSGEVWRFGGLVEERYLSSRRAAEELGISAATLYAYVSRGWIRSEAGSGRNRRYRAEDVRKLKERKQQRGNPALVAEGALHWGTPVLESGITRISGDRFYYRGRDVLSLAADNTIEQVASLIWTGDVSGEANVFRSGPVLPDFFDSISEALGPLAPVGSFQALLPMAAAGDAASYDLRPLSVARTGARILRFLTAVAAGGEVVGEGGGVSGALQRAWAPLRPEAVALLDAALILCADHELPVSTFAARCVASSGATPYAVVTAGLSAVQGVKHGGAIELAETFLGEVEASGSARGVIAGRLRRGERVPGFGHSLYPEGDPRGAALLGLVEKTLPRNPSAELSRDVAREALGLIGEHPTVDFGLATLARALELPPGSAVALFALGRTVGWIGHAIEQYESGAMIRPRARYVGY